MADRPADTARRSEAATNGAEPASPAAPGGIKAWLPTIVTIALMPVLAFVTTRFVLLPRVEKAMQGSSSSSSESASSEKSGEPSGGGGGGGGGERGTSKVTVQLQKILVNVAGTMGTRYLMSSMTLVGSGPDFKDKIEGNRDQLMDLATGAMSTKTIADLEKPGSRNLIRTELLNTFNNALGGPVIKEIYITELAIQ